MDTAETKEESGLSLLDIWHIIVKHVWMIIVSTVVVGACAGVYGFALKTPTYSSDASVMIQVDNGNNTTTDVNNGITLGLRITETVKSLMLSDRIAKTTAEQVYGISDNYKEIQKGLTITSSTTNLMLPLSYESTDKENVQRILDSVIRNTIALVDDTSENFEALRNKITIVDTASEAVYASPNKVLIVFLGLIVGAVLGLAAAFVKELCSDRIIGKKETEEKVNIRVIGLIPDYEITRKKNPDGGVGK